MAGRLLVLKKRLALLRRPSRLLVRWRRRVAVRLARSYLRGRRGIEIGGSAQNDFGLDVLNVDRYGSADTIYKRSEVDAWGRARPVDIVAPAHRLPLEDDSVDFVLASHVLEHVPDPIAALEEWQRVARRHLFLVVPHRDRTFDRERPLTPLAELVERHENAFSSDEDRHWSVWTCETFLELCAHLGLEVAEHRDPDVKAGNGFIVVIDVAASRGGGPAGSAPGPRRPRSSAG